MAGVSKINYKGREILYIDYKGLNEAQMIDTVKKAVDIILADNRQILLLSNITGAFATPGFMEVAKEAGKKTKHLTAKGAIVGITGAKSLLLSVYNTIAGGKLKPFDSEEEAKEYLIK